MRLIYLHEDVTWEAQLFCEEKGHQPTVAVDLDGTLAQDYDVFDKTKIGEPRKGARKALESLREAGFRIIIFTVRGDTGLIKKWLDEHSMVYDYINENPDQPENTSGKVIADVYIDDRAVDGSLKWEKIVKIVKKQLRKKAT